MVVKHEKKTMTRLEAWADKVTAWIGSPASIVVHTIIFIIAFGFIKFGVQLNTILLVLTTAVSLEAIYLALFIQITVNRNNKSLADVEEDIEEIAEDVEGIEKDIDEIEKDIDEIQEDVEEIERDDQEDDLHDEATMKSLNELQTHMQKIMNELQALKDQKK